LLDAKPPEEWLEFLDSILPDDREQIELIQEWFGYCLTPDTSQQKALLLLGPPRSGKGTIARVLTRLLGVANVAGPTLSSLGGPFGLWTLVGKMLAIVSDARLSGRTDQAIVTERLLSITGEDFLTIDRKMIHPVTLRLISRVMVLSNELPKLADSSGALSNRFLITSLERSFLGEEDTGLEDRLMAELPGILLWSIAGWRRLKARGRFIQPSAGEEIRRELNDLASPIGAFIRDLCRVNVGASETVVDLYEAWLAWCASQGRHATTEKNVFGRDLRAAIPGVTTRQKRDGELVARRFEGVGLTEVGKATLSLWRSHTQGTQAKPPVTQQARSKQGETAESEAAYVG
jgi:putative DNA primase/helicase